MCVCVCAHVGYVCVCECAVLIDDLYRVVTDSVIFVFIKPSVLSDSLVCLVV